MFTPVKRWKRILVQVLVGAQLLSAAPFASADTMPCDGMMDMASAPADSEHCSCCPDGVDSAAACHAACVAATGISSVFSVSLISLDSTRVTLPIVTSLSRVFDPPLKPPPIA